MAMEPFSTTYRSSSGAALIVTSTALPSGCMERIVPVPSMCPATMCPPNLPSAAMARSRFTFEPVFSCPRLLRRRVSGMTSAVKWSSPMRTTVRQTPFTAMLSPMAVPSSTLDAVSSSSHRFGAWFSRRTVPISSTIPVNISMTPFGCIPAADPAPAVSPWVQTEGLLGPGW